MKGDFHVRFCERLKLKCFGLLDRFLNALPNAKLWPLWAMQTTTLQTDREHIL